MIRTFFNARVGKNGAQIINGPNGPFLSVDVATDFFSGGSNHPMWVRLKSSKPNLIKLSPFLKKGKLIEISGVLSYPECWLDNSNTIHSMHIIIPDSITFINHTPQKP